MGRAAGRSVSKSGQQRGNKEIGMKRPGQLKVFVRTVNKELEEIEHLILAATVINDRNTQEKR
jgi:hypothetical protein